MAMPIDTTAMSKQYRQQREETARLLAECMLILYKDVTGKQPSDKLVDTLVDAIETELR